MRSRRLFIGRAIPSPRCRTASTRLLIVTKPIVHFTADRPLAADVEVIIAQGRPWFAYPRPDDFTMLAIPYGSWGNGADPDPVLAVFDKAHVPELQPTAEGYPWLAPPHRTHGPVAAGPGGVNNEIQTLACAGKA